MPKQKEADNPATTSIAYCIMHPSWKKIQTVLNGTEALRKATKTYLPQHAAEDNPVYAERLAAATLLNLSKLTLDSWVGRPFSDPVKLEKVPPKVNELLDNVDLLGNDIQTFSQKWFKDGLAKAFSHCYVDFPRVIQPMDGSVRTKQDDINEGVRPYWVFISPEQLFFADAEIIDGREVLREIRLREVITERVGFAERPVTQIRRVFRGVNEDGEEVSMVELYRLKDPKKEGTDEEEWELREAYTFDLDVIPLVTFYADRTDFMLGLSPLEDLVDLNLAHWQSTSDQRAILTVARFPILALSGGTDESKVLEIGPRKWLYSVDPQSKFYYVEHEGKAIGAGRQDLADLELQMSEYGAEFLKKRPGRETATARALDSAEATSALQDVTRRFADALTQALDLTAKWLGLEDGGDAELETDFGPEEVNQAELTTLRETRKMRDLSRVAFLDELKRRGLLNEEFDVEKDKSLLEDEAMDMFGAEPDLTDDEKKKEEDEKKEETE